MELLHCFQAFPLSNLLCPLSILWSILLDWLLCQYPHRTLYFHCLASSNAFLRWRMTVGRFFESSPSLPYKRCHRYYQTLEKSFVLYCEQIYRHYFPSHDVNVHRAKSGEYIRSLISFPMNFKVFTLSYRTSMAWRGYKACIKSDTFKFHRQFHISPNMIVCMDQRAGKEMSEFMKT